MRLPPGRCPEALKLPSESPAPAELLIGDHPGLAASRLPPVMLRRSMTLCRPPRILRAIGETQTQEWVQRAGPEGTQMLERYRAALR